MSTQNKNKSVKRRTRNRKRNKHGNYADKFVQFNPKYLQNLLFNGYVRELKENINISISKDIQGLCRLFVPSMINWKAGIISDSNDTLNDLIPFICILYTSPSQPPIYHKQRHDIWKEKLIQNKLTIRDTHLRFNEKFNSLWSYQRKLLCYKIIMDKKWPIKQLQVKKADDNSIYELMLFIEYTLLNCSQITKIDLSNINLNDNHIVWICNLIQNIVKYWNKIEAHSLNIKRRRHWSYDRKIWITSKNIGSNTREYWSTDGGKTWIHKLKWTEIHLSENKNITDKHLWLLLKTIKNHIPKMKQLHLSSTNITNKSISTIMRHNFDDLVVYLDKCEGITLKELKKYPKNKPNFWCNDQVYFTKKEKKKPKNMANANFYETNDYSSSCRSGWDPSDWD